MGCTPHSSGGNSGGTEAQASVLPRITQRDTYTSSFLDINKYSEQERPYKTGLMVLYSLDSVRVPEQLWEMLQLLAGEGIYRSAAFSKGDGTQQPLSLPQHPGPSV